MRGGLGLPGLSFELMPLLAGWQLFGFRPKVCDLLGEAVGKGQYLFETASLHGAPFR